MTSNTATPSPRPSDSQERTSSRPGVMLYFDLAPMLTRLSNEQRGQLLMAILDYARLGTQPDTDDCVLYTIWPLIEQRIDTDAQAYEDKVTKNRYAAYCREAKRDGLIPLDYSRWLSAQADDEQAVHSTSSDIDGYHTTSSDDAPDQSTAPVSKCTPNTDTTSNSVTATNAATESNTATASKTNNKGVNARPGRFAPPTVDEIRLYCLERNNGIDAQRFYDHYASIGWYVGKSQMQDWRAAIRKWERSEDYAKSSPGTGHNSTADTGRWDGYDLRYDT